jgi:uncharacterized iron-regulated membrane protein
MKAPTLRAWYAVHRWTSLVCTANLLLLCLTGMVLIFHVEIDRMLGQGQAAVVASDDITRPSTQTLVDTAVGMHPGSAPKSVSFSDSGDNRVAIRVGAPGVAALRGGATLFFDRLTGARCIIDLTGDTFTGFVMKLHMDLFLKLPGQLFIGAIGIIFVLSMVSGIVLYAPFTRKLGFGLLRFGRQTRIVQADLHNLCAVVTMTWALVVGLTGVFLAFSPLIISVWQKTELADLIRTYPGAPPAKMVTVDTAVAAAVAAVPGKDPAYVFYPGTEYATQRHFTVVQRGHTELQRRIYTISMVDAESGRVTESRGMPWYMQLLLLAGPFHFGDYAGLPLKLLWALFDLLTAVAIVSGFIVWIKRTKSAVAARVGNQTSNQLTPALLEGKT